MKTTTFAALASLAMIFGAAVPLTAGAGGDPCTYCDAVFAECLANGGTRPACRQEYLACTYDFGCVIP